MADPIDRLWKRAQSYFATHQIAPARATLEAMLARDPAHTLAHLTLGGIAWQDDRMHDSVRHVLDAARTVPDDGMLLGEVIMALHRVGEIVMVRELLQRPVLAQTKDGELLGQMAAWQNLLGDHPASLEFHERVSAAGVDGAQYRLDHAIELSFNGRLQQAETKLEDCVRMDNPSSRAFMELARLRRQTPARNHLQLLDRQLGRVAQGSREHAEIEFARYKEFEDLGRYDDAWSALAHGNALMALRARYDFAREERLLEGLQELCSADFVRAERIAHTGPTPIFIIGMTRSGTTLLDRILGNHSQIESAGELEDFGRQLRHVAGRCTVDMLDERLLARLPSVDYIEVGQRYLAQTQWRANGSPFYVDKLPPNWVLAGLIRRALPQARILHMVRDPMDVCFSNFRVMLGESSAWSCNQQALAHYFLEYKKMMAHWHTVMPGQVLDVNYAGLVNDPEPMARKVFSFCSLEYEEGCLDLARNRTTVATLSWAQVRGGIHAKAFEEWRPYAAQLEELRAALTP